MRGGRSVVGRADGQVAIINLGYADGYLRTFSDRGSAHFEGQKLDVIGRVSMDLVALTVPAQCRIASGATVDIDYDLLAASRATGLSSYELLTGLSSRFDRRWT